MPPKVQQKSKAQKALAAASGGKSKKKKWSKGKTRDKVNNKVLFDEETYARLINDVPKMKLITSSAVVEKLKVTASLARAGMLDLEQQGLIRRIAVHSRQQIFTRATNVE